MNVRGFESSRYPVTTDESHIHTETAKRPVLSPLVARNAVGLADRDPPGRPLVRVDVPLEERHLAGAVVVIGPFTDEFRRPVANTCG
ncbi:hypothetical protein BN903_35 [Halorubrum sp. AJ67]|nr:hypothetical protein BN903_35 [Halorubrum sp. AJ67]